MPAHVDILDQSEPLRRSLMASLALHAGVFAVITVSSIVHFRKTADWGSPNPGGSGPIGVKFVRSIPLPARQGNVNPLANDSKTTVPLPPPQAKPQTRAKEPASNAIPLKSSKAEKKRASESASSRTTYRAPGQDRPNQVYSTTGPALVSPLVGQSGSGGVGIGQGSTLGSRFGWYADLIIRKVEEHWHPDTQSQTSSAAVITFTLMKDGSVRDARIEQRSGNTILDYSAQRAVLDSAPFQPIPPGAGDSARVELTFRLRQ